MSTELSAFASAETDGQTSDSDSDDLGESSGDEFRFKYGEGDGEVRATGEKGGGGKFSWLTSKLSLGTNRNNKYQRLSVQSGDIVQTPNTAPATFSPDSSAAAANVTTMSTTIVACTSVAVSTEAQEQLDKDAITKKEVAEKGGLYAFMFPIVHTVVKFVFYHQKFSLVPIVMMGGHVALTVMFVLLALFIYPPSLNLTIEAFSIPNHPSQIHWDAYTAAKNGKIWNDSVSKVDSSPSYEPPLPLGKSNKILKRNIIEGCTRDPNVRYQTRLHVVWELDLVFRVPDSNPDPDKNILTEQRIRRIHEIEEHIYNLPDYKDFCHKGLRTDFCDPINSLLTWLYPRHKENGSFVYNPDHLTHNLTDSLLQLKNNHTNALWFTGGQVTIINSTSFIAKLLRSQVRVGLPLPCFTYTGNRVSDRYGEQGDLVTKFFVSLIPYLEGASNGEVEVLYGGFNIFDYEVKHATIHDIILAAISLGLVLLLAFVMSGFSLWLTLVVLYTIASSFPVAFFVYTKIFGINTFGLLNVVSFFVIIGIGVDDILVFLNTFKQSSQLAGLNTVHKRIAHTIIEASKATFFTSITTSVAFFANAISSITAVYQFGVFMGLVVIFCYVQVVLVIPFALHIWNSYFLIIENIIYLPCARLCQRRKRESLDLPAVRMTHRSMEDGDSGIEILENGNGSREQSDNSSTASSSSVSDTNVLIPESENKDSEMEIEPTSDKIENEPQSSHFDDCNVDNSPLLSPVTQMEVTLTETRDIEEPEPNLADSVLSGSKSSAESRWTELQQIGMIQFVAYPVIFWFLIKQKFSNKHKARLCSFMSLTMIVGFVLVLLASFVATSFLKPTDRPPQFFKPSSNIQKMLDLSGNLTSADAVNCYSCSAWYTPGAIPTASPPVQPSQSPPTPSHSSPPTPHASNPPTSSSHSSPPTAQTEPPPSHLTTSRPSQPHTPRPTQHQVTTPSNTHSHTDSPPNPNPDSHTTPPTKKPPNPTPDSHVTSGPPAPTGPGTNENVVGNQFSNNAVVYVVFGIDSVHRRYDASHVIPEEGEGDFAILVPKFNSTFTCPMDPANEKIIMGSIRAMCRICLNISNPDNGLVLKGNYQCFAPGLAHDFGCLLDLARHIQECLPLLSSFTSSSSSKGVTVKAGYGEYINDRGTRSLQYLAMAFRSTSNPTESPFTSMTSYHKWEDFLANELKEVSHEQSLYDKAGDLLSSAFQTGEQWVQVNLELVAVYGSIYGILISFSLCSLVVAVLSHNWRIVLSMFLTIMAILFSLLGLFSMFGWRLGIVEAVSLSILVGNALDYCIHLSEGYMAVDKRHLAFVDRFKFTAGASVRVKRVMAAISFIGVSIISSAITTIVAILPLLGTWIQLFTRFGLILLIETLVAIIYTLVFCSTFLALFGPLKTTLANRIINALGTIFGTIGFYLVGLIGVYIATRVGVDIPGPDGSPLFS